MAKDIGIGVVGLGMGLDLLYVNDDPETRFEVRGLCSATRAKVEAAARKHDIGFATTDYAELLKRDDIDVIGVYTPDHLHGPQVLQALEAGKHVVVTKPFTTGADDARAIADLAERRGLKVIIGETCRFYTSYLAAKQMLDDGRLGDLVWADAWYVHQLDDSLFDITPWRLEAPQDFMYGGVCHPMDSLVWLMGEPEEVHCYAFRSELTPRYPLPQNFTINVRFGGGLVARCVGSYGIVQPPYPMMGLALYGTKGSVVADFTDFEPSSLKVRLAGGSDAASESVRTQLQASTQAYHYPADLLGAYGQGLAVKRYMAELEDAIVNDRQPSPNARESIATIATLDACWKSARTGKAVRL